MGAAENFVRGCEQLVLEIFEYILGACSPELLRVGHAGGTAAKKTGASPREIAYGLGAFVKA